MKVRTQSTFDKHLPWLRNVRGHWMHPLVMPHCKTHWINTNVQYNNDKQVLLCVMITVYSTMIKTLWWYYFGNLGEEVLEIETVSVIHIIIIIGVSNPDSSKSGMCIKGEWAIQDSYNCGAHSGLPHNRKTSRIAWASAHAFWRHYMSASTSWRLDRDAFCTSRVAMINLAI